MTIRRWLTFALATLVAPLTADAQLVTGLTNLYEYGNAAASNATSGAGVPRGADFSGSATGNYTITAGGTDFWDVSDHGSAIFSDPATTSGLTGDFSAIVKVSIGLEGEVMPGEWGRTGIMARTDPAAANSAYFAVTQKFDGPKQGGILQFRDSLGAGTSRVSDGTPTTLTVGGGTGNTATPVWLGLHRYQGQIFATWADDNGGAPGTWSPASGRVGSADHQGDVYLGLFHQNHNVQPETSTGSFDGFTLSDFDNSLGDFPLAITNTLTLSGGMISGQLGGIELGSTGAPTNPLAWTLDILDPSQAKPGVYAESYLTGNPGSLAGWSGLIQTGTVNGAGVIPNIAWSGNANPDALGLEKYPDVFALPADTNSPGDNQENYSVRTRGEIYIPEAGTYKFKDGVDDYTLLAIDGDVLIDDNNWTGPAGNDNGGSPIVEKTFDKSGWYAFEFRMSEGGGGDAGTLAWDYDWSDADGDGATIGDGVFPAANDQAFVAEALVPAEFFRTMDDGGVVASYSGNSFVDGKLVDDSGAPIMVPDGMIARMSVAGGIATNVVPEPGSAVLCLLALMGLAGLRRRS